MSKNWKMPERSVKLVHIASGKTIWLDRPSQAMEEYINEETKCAWKMFNVYPNGFEAEFPI